jgi:hypothetical protein
MKVEAKHTNSPEHRLKRFESRTTTQSNSPGGPGKRFPKTVESRSQALRMGSTGVKK